MPFDKAMIKRKDMGFQKKKKRLDLVGFLTNWEIFATCAGCGGRRCPDL